MKDKKIETGTYFFFFLFNGCIRKHVSPWHRKHCNPSIPITWIFLSEIGFCYFSFNVVSIEDKMNCIYTCSYCEDFRNSNKKVCSEYSTLCAETISWASFCGFSHLYLKHVYCNVRWLYIRQIIIFFRFI